MLRLPRLAPGLPALVPLLASLLACPSPVTPDGGTDAGVVEEVPRIHTPRWAFEPWISKDISDGPDTYAFVDGFLERDIPVGAVVLDSPWETNYNTFIPNEARYPDFGGMVADLDALDIRVVLWCTQMLNESSYDLEPGGDIYPGPADNLREASLNDYLVNDGTTYFWWKGYGAGIDFMNPEATDWWHAQYDHLLELGVAGWKLDFGEEYITTDVIQTTVGTEVSKQEYSEAYYRDFLEHGAKKVGTDDFVTMVRPYDESYGFPGRFFARPEHAPVGWVGDQFRNWEGLVDGLDHIFRSAEAGYVVLGSDIGGYLDNDVGSSIPFDADVLFAWTALNAWLPFFQLHGRANLTPWSLPEPGREEEYTAAYRYWATLHHQLVPFFYSLAEEGYGDGTPPFVPIVRPVEPGPGRGEAAPAWSNDWRFFTGEAFLVAPLVEGGGVRDVELPAGHRYVDWFRPGEDDHPGGQTLTGYTLADPAHLPVFVADGAIVPLLVDRELTGLGPAVAPDAYTVLVYPGPGETRFFLHDEDDGRVELVAGPSGVTLPALSRDVLLRIRVSAAPTSVSLDGADLDAAAGPSVLTAPEAAWAWEAETRSLFVRVPGGAQGRQVSWVP